MDTRGSKGLLDEQMLALDEILLHQHTKGLQDANPRVRRKAAHGLTALGKVAERARPLLEALLEDADRGVRKAATETLKKIKSVT
jgi:HEAT repeat protein